jgi:hypothetical protein
MPTASQTQSPVTQGISQQICQPYSTTTQSSNIHVTRQQGKKTIVFLQTF